MHVDTTGAKRPFFSFENTSRLQNRNTCIVCFLWRQMSPSRLHLSNAFRQCWSCNFTVGWCHDRYLLHDGWAGRLEQYEEVLVQQPGQGLGRPSLTLSPAEKKKTDTFHSTHTRNAQFKIRENNVIMPMFVEMCCSHQAHKQKNG